MQELPSGNQVQHTEVNQVQDASIVEHHVKEGGSADEEQVEREEDGNEERDEEVMLQAARKNGRALTGLVIGVFSLILWWLPVLGVLIAGTGLVIAVRRFHEIEARKTAYAGVILNSVGLLLGLVFTVGIIFSIVRGA